MMPRWKWCILAAIAAAILLVRCGNLSLGLWGGGGTETGSPGIIACASAVFDEAELKGQWSPETYLPQGEIQLDPGRITAMGELAKFSMPDTDTVILDNHNLLKITWSRDTLIFIDSLFIRDTVVIDSVRTDTTRPSTDFTIVVSHRILDRVIIVDTVEKRDTVLVPRQDTLFIRLTDSVNAPVMTVRDTIPGIKKLIYRGVMANPYPVVINAIQPDLITFSIVPRTGIVIMMNSVINTPDRRDTGYSRLVRISQAVGNMVSEEYRDADGDGFLNKASGTLSMRARLLASYDNSGVRTTLTVVFDAGSDRIFSSTGNNRILSLSRSQLVGNRLIEAVRYSSPPGDSTCDSTFLTIEQHPETDKVQDAEVRYSCVPAGDTLDHRQNKLNAFFKRFVFRSGAVQSLEVDAVLDTAVGRTSPFRNSRVSAKMFYGDARMGTFEGRLDMTERTLGGIYTENGVSYRVTYYRSNGNLYWEEMQ